MSYIVDMKPVIEKGGDFVYDFRHPTCKQIFYLRLLDKSEPSYLQMSNAIKYSQEIKHLPLKTEFSIILEKPIKDNSLKFYLSKILFTIKDNRIESFTGIDDKGVEIPSIGFDVDYDNMTICFRSFTPKSEKGVLNACSSIKTSLGC